MTCILRKKGSGIKPGTVQREVGGAGRVARVYEWVGVFSRREALDAGVGRGRFARRGYVRLRRSVYVEPTLASLVAESEADRHAVQITAAALKLAGDPVASLESAALLWGIDVLGRELRGTVQLTRPRRGRGSVATYPGLLVHHAALPPHHVTTHRGVRVTNVSRTVMDIARARPFRAGVVAADSALRHRLCTRDDLLAVARDCTRWLGVRRACDVAEFTDGRSESPLESISRAAFAEHGVPPPAIQEWVTPYDRVDFLWKRERVVGEADGRSKYATRDDLIREKDRQELFERLGYRVIRWGWDEAFRRPDALASWLHKAVHPWTPAPTTTTWEVGGIATRRAARRVGVLSPSHARLREVGGCL